MYNLKKLIFALSIMGGICPPVEAAQSDYAVKKMIVNQYKLLQGLTQNSIVTNALRKDKENSLLAGKKIEPNSIELSAEQFKLSFKQCKASLKMIKKIVKNLKTDDSLAQACQTLYLEGKNIKNELQDFHFSSEKPEALEKLRQCEEIVQNVTKMLYNNSFIKLHLESPDSFKNSHPNQSIAKPLTGEKLPEPERNKKADQTTLIKDIKSTNSEYIKASDAPSYSHSYRSAPLGRTPSDKEERRP